MAGIGTSLTDELYLKLAEDDARKKYKNHHERRNKDNFTGSSSVKNKGQRYGPRTSDSNSDMKMQSNFVYTNLNKTNFHKDMTRNCTTSRQSYNCGSHENYANNGSSKTHIPKSKSSQNSEMFYSKQEERQYSEKPVDHHPKGRIQARNRSLNRKQSDHLGTKEHEIDDFDRSYPKKRSQSSHSRNGRSNDLPHSDEVGKHHSQFRNSLGFKRLQDLCNDSPTDLVMFLINSKSGFEELLKTDLRPDILILVIKVLAKVCSCDFGTNKTALLSMTCQTLIFDSIQNRLFRMPTDDSVERKRTMGTFISDLLVFYETVMCIFPNTASEKFKGLFINTDIMMKSVEDYHAINLSKQKEQFNKLNKQLQNMIEERQSKKDTMRSKDELQKFSAPPDDFREKSIYPTQDDLLGEENPFLRPNIVDGAYVDTEHYLDVQFRLLREDFVSPLREGLAKLLDKSLDNKKRHRIDNIRIYRNVQFGDPKVVKDCIGVIVHFDPNKKMKIKWEYSKRFMFGSLLLFTNDNFKHVIFGTVLERNIVGLKNGELIVTLHQQSNKLNVYESNFLMIESEVYFEPYKHVMKALQGFDESSFPMKQYIIFVQKESPPPAYLLLRPFDMYVVNYTGIQVLVETSWPSKESLGLDRSQLAAFKAALTEEFVVIQGPPGTGKTFVGLKIAKVLLQNASIWNINKSPILVVCYTNHALDQFLEGLLSVTDKIVRVGGQSKSDALSEYNLREKRRFFNFKKANSHLKREYHYIMSQIMKTIQMRQANLEELQKHRGIVSVQFMQEHKIISPQQSHCFQQNDNADERLYEWLIQGFEEFYDTAADTQENIIFGTVDGQVDVPEGLAMEEEGIWQTVDDDAVLFDLGDITHNIRYAIDFHRLENSIIELQSTSEHMQNSPSVSKHELEELQEHCLYMQQMLQYWKTCLEMNHHSEAAHVQRLHLIRNIWELNMQDRWLLYKDWVNSVKKILRTAVSAYEAQYRDYSKRYEEVKEMYDFEILQEALVVGMTTTNAGRLQTLLQALKPKIVIVEEAAEVLESHIVVSLTNKCEQVILIGDHKQLRPNPAVYKLARRYHFDISLFERMINNGMQFHCLENQHRMRPEIAQLITPTIYPDLKNDISVYNYSTVRGITKSLFFLTHDVHEEEVDEIMSHQNCYEADFMLALCRHLILQGYKPQEITILVTYKGQMFCMKQKQRRLAITSDVHITVVDNYQGEENKIILLSLVRSNENAKIGFLSIENRVCVALSRAKEGLYIIGNMDNLVQSSQIWPKIKESLVKQDSFGTHLTLQCEVHPDQQTLVNCAEDFKKVPEGGCSLMCEMQLQCGHRCESVCHVNNREHKEYKCYKKCERNPPDCELQHLCQKLCYETCGQCETPMERTLPCEHVKVLPCHINPKEYKCLESVEAELPHCNHKIMKRCYEDTATYPCSVPCPDRLPCGHSCMLKCHVLVDPDHLEYKCKKRCPKTNDGCTMNHMCTKPCYEECGLCTYEVDKQLHCNHLHKMKCSEDPASVDCTRKCQKTMPCGHPCPRKCYEVCGGCQKKVKKVIPSCGHEIQIKCCETPTQSLCRSPCRRSLPCGHRCGRRCDQLCTEQCHELIPCPVVPLCGHSINIPCYLKNNADSKSLLVLQFCQIPCGKMLSCGHTCEGTCGECMQGRIHVACAEKCDRNLICGHRCKVPCAASCPPCTAKCQYKCKHSKCPRKCGVPCVPCQEPCNWNCEHLRCTKLCYELCDRKPCYEPCKKKLKCGHNCIGFCGDKCPPLCRICDEKEVTEIFFGTEDDENARFVYLVDCKHTLESEGLEEWFQKSDKEITQKTCPRCRSQVLGTERFMNYLKLILMDISRVKRKIFGERNRLETEREIVVKSLYEVHGQSSLSKMMTVNSKMYAEMFQMCANELDQVRNNRRYYLSQTILQSMKTQIAIFNDLVTSITNCIIEPNVILKKEVGDRLFYQFDYMLEKLKQYHSKLSTQETEDFNRECKRFSLATQLAVFESSSSFPYLQTQREANRLYWEACSILHSIEIYTNEKHAELKNIIDRLKKFAGVPLTVKEREDIVKAMDFKQGHWFKCPNNHIYSIGECGGAMEVAKCPECGEDIGGSNHHLLSTNRLATEMDGATRHAYDGGLF